MKDLIYKFLDMYVGDGMNVIKRIEPGVLNPYTFMPISRDVYNVRSNNGTIILFFLMTGTGDVITYPAFSVYQAICGMFSIDPGTSKNYIRSWFQDRNNIKHSRELLNYIPPSL